MRVGATSSVITHIAVLLVAQFGLPGGCSGPPVAADYLPVVLVNSAEMAELMPPPPEPPPPEPPPATVPPPEPPPAEVDVPPPEPPIAEPAPSEPPVPVPDDGHEVAAEPAPDLDAAAVTDQAAPEPPTEADVLSLLDQIGRAPARGPDGRPIETLRDRAEEAAMVQLTPEELEEIAALKQAIIDQVSPCWRPPIGTGNAHRLLVEVDVKLSRSGRVESLRVFDQARMARDPAFRAAAEAAQRAFLSPQCTPLRLPADKYGLWSEIIFTFNPSEMVN